MQLLEYNIPYLEWFALFHELQKNALPVICYYWGKKVTLAVISLGTDATDQLFLQRFLLISFYPTFTTFTLIFINFNELILCS